MDATTFLISRLQKLLSIHEIDWAEAECITRSFGVMVQWLDSCSLCYCRLVLWLPGGKTNLKFYATAKCQAGHHKQCVNLRKTGVLLRYWDLFPVNPNLNPKGKAQFSLQCYTANGTSPATRRDHSCGLVSFRKWRSFLIERERPEMHKSSNSVTESFQKLCGKAQTRRARDCLFVTESVMLSSEYTCEGPRCTA